VVSVVSQGDEFAAAVLALLRDDVLWRSRSALSIEYARKHFSKQALRAALEEGLGAPLNGADARGSPDQVMATGKSHQRP
jgi:hypothetical protein